MKVSCDVIRDLMVLEDADSCSEDSKSLIVEHVESCDTCKKMWHTNKNTVLENVVEEQSAEEFSKLKKKIKRTTLRKIITAISVVIIVFMCTIGIFYYYNEYIPCDADDIEISNVCYYKDGMIMKITLVDGTSFENGHFWTGGSYDFDGNNIDEAFSFIISRTRFHMGEITDMDASFYMELETVPKAIYLNEENGGDEVLIWQEGDPISDITEEILAEYEEYSNPERWY